MDDSHSAKPKKPTQPRKPRTKKEASTAPSEWNPGATVDATGKGLANDPKQVFSAKSTERQTRDTQQETLGRDNNPQQPEPTRQNPPNDPKQVQGAKTTETQKPEANHGNDSGKEVDSGGNLTDGESTTQSTDAGEVGDREQSTPQTTTDTSAESAGDRERSTTQQDQDTSAGNVGDVPLSVAETGLLYGLAAENLPREESQADATRRWRRTGIAEQVAVYRDRKREEYSRANPKAKRRDAHEYAWECAMAEFPPAGIEPQIVEELPPEPEPIEPDILSTTVDKIESAEPPAIEPAPPVDMGVSGLGDLPESWGTLPANAQLQVEIAWVSANRLRVRSGHGVDLSRALSPAPSYSALSWLETSILFPSKFADISVKATAQQDDEREGIRREKLAIEEIRGLLSEMLEG